MPGGVFQEGDPFGNEATSFIKEQIMQKEVEIEVETIDKGKKRIKINTGSLSFPDNRTNDQFIHIDTH